MPVPSHRYFPSTALLLSEALKLTLSLLLSIQETSRTLAPSTPLSVLFLQVYNAVFRSDGWKLAAPAAAYTLQNLLMYVAAGNLDAVQMQVLYQLKILTTALFSVLLLNRRLRLGKWIALVVLTLGVCVVSFPSVSTGQDSLFLHDAADNFFPRSLHEIGQASPELYQPKGHLSKRSATYEGITEDLLPPEPVMNYSLGITAILIAAAVSGLTGVYFEKVLKESPSQASVWIRNVQLSFYSFIAALTGGVIYQDGAGIAEHGFFSGYNSIVWMAVGLQAAGGLIASVVIRDADNIVKNFATSISIICSFLASVLIFDFKVTWTFLLGTGLVLMATWLYSLPERRRYRPTGVRVVSFEKAAVVGGVDTPKTGDSTGRMALGPFDEVGGRVESPMLTRVASFKRDD